jgi:hypothetical protein
MSFPENFYLTVSAEILQLCKSSFISCPGGGYILGGGPWSALMRPVGRIAKFFQMVLEAAYGIEINITFSGNSSGEHPYSQHANCMPLQNLTSVALCCVTILHVLEGAFIFPSTRCTCVMIMPFNQLLDMPHLPGGWINLAKEKCSLTGM